MSEKKKPPKEQYLEAKWVCDNSDRFDYRDVALAREFVYGFEAALQVVREAVEAEKHSMGDKNPIGAGINAACGRIILRIEKLMEES